MSEWLTEAAITTISGFLDFKSLAYMCSTSKPIKNYIINDFHAKAHPHAVAFIANQILNERKKTLSGFQMIRRSETLIRFIHDDSINDNGYETFIELKIADNKRWFSIKSSYSIRESAFSTSFSHVEVIIHPSYEKPTRHGTVTVTKHNTDRSISFEYANGIDPKLAIERWCPLVAPEDERDSPRN